MKKLIMMFSFITISCLNEPKKILVEEPELKYINSIELNNVKNISEFDYIGKSSEGLRYVSKNDKGGYINENGTLVIALQYDAGWDFENGLARVYKRYSPTGNYPYTFKWGFINTKGEEVIPLIYDDAMPFENGLSKVELEGSILYINENGFKIQN